jgi:hypothetical protein
MNAGGSAAPGARRRARAAHPCSRDDALFVGNRLTAAGCCAICFHALTQARPAAGAAQLRRCPR